VIGRLTGTPVARTLDGVVLDVNGVGYLLRLTLRALRKTESEREVTIDTYLHVR
jgi:Holliday junction resolvasome RuvABC DNA-binding subunit